MALIAHTTAFAAGAATTSPVSTTGATLIVVLATFPATFTSVTDNKGNSYTQIISEPFDIFGGTLRLFYCSSPTVGAGHTFTATGVGSYQSISVQAWSGFTAYAGLDNGANSGGTSVSTIQPGLVTPASSASLVITGSIYSPDTIDLGFTISDSSNNSMAYLVTSSGVNPTWSFPSAPGSAVIAVFTPTSTTITETLNPALTIGFGAGFTVTGGPAIHPVLNPAATIGLDMGFTVSGGTESVGASAAATIGFDLGFVLSAPVQPTLSAGATLGIDLGFSVGSTTVTVPLAFGMTLDSSAGFGNRLRLACPIGSAFVGVPFSEQAMAVGGSPPYTYSLVLGTVIPPNLNIACLGNSTTAGDFPVGVIGWPAQLNSLLGTTCLNLAVDGSVMSSLLDPGGQVDQAIAAYVGGKDNRATILISVNNFGTLNTPLATVQANYITAVARLRAQGFYVIACTMTNSNYTTYAFYPLYIAQVLALNSWLLAGGSGAQQVCDFAGIPQLQNPADATYFYDELHLQTAGCALEAAAMANVITDPLPPGLGLALQTGFVEGIPQDVGNFPYVIQVTDSVGATATASCDIVVTAPTPPWPPPSCTLVPAPSYNIPLALTPTPEEQDGS